MFIMFTFGPYAFGVVPRISQDLSFCAPRYFDFGVLINKKDLEEDLHWGSLEST